MAELRYELIGDASSFRSAAQEASEASEQLDTSIQEVNTSVRELTDGQTQLRDEQGRFVSTAREAANAAEVQEAALSELNERGIETTQQIREQIDELEQLENIYGEDASASRDLSNAQQRLRTQLSEVGASAAQQNRSLNRLDQEFGQATVTMTDFTARQDRLQQELRATASAQQQAAAAGTTMRSSAAAAANNLNIEFTQALQDVQFGIAGLANQIPLMSEQFSQLQARTGSTTGALSALKNSLMGPTGFIAAGTLLIQMGPELVSFFTSTASAAQGASKAYQDAADDVLRLQNIELPDPLTTPGARRQQERLQTAVENLEQRQELLSAATVGRTVSGERAEELARVTSRIERYNTRLDRLNEILGERADRLQLIRDVQGDLLLDPPEVEIEETVVGPDDIEFAETLWDLVKDTREEIERAAEAPPIPQFQTGGAPMFPARAARRRRRQASQAALEGLPSMAAPSPDQTESQFDALASQLGQAIQAERLGFSEVGDQIGQSMLQSARMAVVQGDISPDDFEAFKQAAEDAGIEWEQAGNQRNQQLAQSIQMAAQLGTTMVQAAQQGQVEWNQLLGSILTTIGGIVGQANPVAGAGIAASGQLIGSFQSGGRVDTPFQWVGERGPELAALPQGTQVYDHETSMRMAEASASRRQSVSVNVESELTRLPGGDLGLIVRENQSRREKFGYDQ